MNTPLDTLSTRGTLILRGIVADGLGEAAHFMLMKWFRVQCRERLGFNPSPGTFNLRMQGEHWEQLRRALRPDQTGARKPVIELTPPEGYCTASCFALRVGDKIDAFGIVPHVDHYPHDKLEIIAPINLRTALGVATGTAIKLAFTTTPLARKSRR